MTWVTEGRSIKAHLQKALGYSPRLPLGDELSVYLQPEGERLFVLIGNFKPEKQI